MSDKHKKCSTSKIIRSLRRIIFFSVIASVSLQLSAQNYFFDNYSVTEGLAQSTVFDILQDNNHYIWLGTRAGVSRFDGREFKNYSIDYGLAPNGVRILFQDKDSVIWMGHSGGGVTTYNGSEFVLFTQPGDLFKSDITAFSVDSFGHFWISSELSGAVMITKTGTTLHESEFEHFIGDKLSDRIFGAVTLKSGHAVFITDAFLKTYDLNTGTFRNFELNGMPRFFQITSLYEDSRNHIWIGTYNGGLYQYIPDDDSCIFWDYLRDGIGSNFISTITEDIEGNTLIGTWGGGVTSISPDGLITFNQDNGLPDNKIRKIMSDAEGNILIGTNEHGLSIFKGREFMSFFEKDGLVNSQVWAILADRRGDYWFGTNNGISIYNPRATKEKQFRTFFKLSGNRIRMLKEDSRGRIWIGTDNQGVFTYIPEGNIFTYEARLNSYIHDLVVTALETDNKGGVWTGTLYGLVYYTFDDRNAIHYTQTSGLAGNEISALFFDNKNRLWIGSKGAGLTCFAEGKFIEYPEFKDKIITPSSITLDNNGLLWIGTEAHGILVFNPEENNIVKTYTEENGILANMINIVNVDRQNNIYIGTNKGLNIFNSTLDRVFTFGRKNGFPGIETKPNATFRDKYGHMWFGTVTGVTRFNPDINRKINEEPFTHIIKMRVNLKDTPIIPGLSLNYRKNNIIFDYVSICLTNPDAVKYSIFLEGADHDWRSTTETTVTYPALAPKKYTFNLIAQNSDGNWNKQPISYSFQIKPPFYKTWWFIIICIIFGIILIAVYITIREQNLKRENRILEEKVRERTAEVVAQKEELAEKNKDITDSIRYAKRIQFAILPPEIPFKDTFILFKPKDIVSGDFYWLHVQDNMEFLAAVDCTGHGVPGAFMSIIGYNLLNKIIKEQNIYKPSEILNSMNKELILSLQRQDEVGAIQDGMDIALICYHKDTQELEFAGALNPLYIIRNGELEEGKADRFSIGRASLEMEKQFTNHSYKIIPGDTIFLFSDGYADQFGGESGKKFKAKPMKELLLAVQDQPMEIQKVILENTIEAWRGEIHQVDDILVIGRRF